MATHFSSRNWLIILLAILFVAYCLFQARFLILGPQVWIEAPKDGATVSEPVITLSGRAKNAAWISLNGRQIYTDDIGLWSEKLILAQGLSIMSVTVRDRFGREKTESVRIILN